MLDLQGGWSRGEPVFRRFVDVGRHLLFCCHGRRYCAGGSLHCAHPGGACSPGVVLLVRHVYQWMVGLYVGKMQGSITAECCAEILLRSRPEMRLRSRADVNRGRELDYVPEEWRVVTES